MTPYASITETRGTCRLTSALTFESCESTDLLERSTGTLEIQNGKVSFPVTPFEIITLRFR